MNSFHALRMSIVRRSGHRSRGVPDRRRSTNLGPSDAAASPSVASEMRMSHENHGTHSPSVSPAGRRLGAIYCSRSRSVPWSDWRTVELASEATSLLRYPRPGANSPPASIVEVDPMATSLAKECINALIGAGSGDDAHEQGDERESPERQNDPRDRVAGSKASNDQVRHRQAQQDDDLAATLPPRQPLLCDLLGFQDGGETLAVGIARGGPGDLDESGHAPIGLQSGCQQSRPS